MPTLITRSTVLAALRDHRARLTKDITDSKADGLQIRVRPMSCRWSVRGTLHGSQRRYDLGDVVEGDEALAEARQRAGRVREMLRNGMNPDAQVAAWVAGVSLDQQLRLFEPPPPAEKASWTWEAAKAAYLAWLKEHRRKDTRRDYRQKLGTPEMDRFAGRRVCDITRNEICKAVDDIMERGVESQAQGCKRVLSAMWSWLADGTRQEQTSVVPNLLLNWKLESNRAELGDPNAAPAVVRQSEVAPPEIMLGRVLVISRQLVFTPQQSAAIQLWLATAQRRRTVLEARRFSFKSTDVDEMWEIEPYFRKSGTKRGRKVHLVPVVGFGIAAVKALDLIADGTGNSQWLVPRLRDPSKSADINMLNNVLDDMPGVAMSTHPCRYALGSYGPRDLGFGPSEAELVIDHLEGVDPKDVTGSFYNLDPAIRRKREMLLAWVAWLELWAARAIDADPLLLDREYLIEGIYRRRNGDAKLAARIAYRAARGLPLWPTLESESVADASESEKQEAAE